MHNKLNKVAISQLNEICGRLEAVRITIQSGNFQEKDVAEELFRQADSIQYLGIEFQVEKFIKGCAHG